MHWVGKDPNREWPELLVASDSTWEDVLERLSEPSDEDLDKLHEVYGVSIAHIFQHFLNAPEGVHTVVVTLKEYHEHHRDTTE